MLYDSDYVQEAYSLHQYLLKYISPTLKVTVY